MKLSDWENFRNWKTVSPVQIQFCGYLHTSIQNNVNAFLPNGQKTTSKHNLLKKMSLKLSQLTEKQLEILTSHTEKKVYTSSRHGRIDSVSYCLKWNHRYSGTPWAYGLKRNDSYDWRDGLPKKFDYVITLKGNQSSLHDDVKSFFEMKDNETYCKDYQIQKWSCDIQKDHGRIEKRE